MRYHRTLSTYLNCLAEAGLVLDRMAEPAAEGSLAEERPDLPEVPLPLIARCLKVD